MIEDVGCESVTVKVRAKATGTSNPSRTEERVSDDWTGLSGISDDRGEASGAYTSCLKLCERIKRETTTRG
jgi:hypothetical protein